MPMNPAVLQMISNPTGGSLRNLPQMYAAGMVAKNQRVQAETAQREQQYLMYDMGSKATGSYAKAMLDWHAENPNATEEEWAAEQTKFRNTMPEMIRNFVPEHTQTVEELERGYANSMNIQQMLNPSKNKEKAFDPITLSDGEQTVVLDKNTQSAAIKQFLLDNPNARVLNSSSGGSEFERLHKKIEAGVATPMEEHRAGVLAGQELREGQERSLELREREDIIKRNKEYKDTMDKLDEMGGAIDMGIAALDSSDEAIADIWMAQNASSIFDSNVRAYAMFEEFRQPFGNLAERVGEQIHSFFMGKRTERERAELKAAMQDLKDRYVTPSRERITSRQRAYAKDLGYDALQVAPPQNLNDLLTTEYADTQRKKEMLPTYFPSVARMTPEQIRDSDYSYDIKLQLLRLLHGYN